MSYWDWSIKNEDYLKRTIQRCKKQNIILPTFKELKHPKRYSNKVKRYRFSGSTSVEFISHKLAE